MVKIFLLFLFLVSSLFSNEMISSDDTNLTLKIKSFIDEQEFQKNKDFIKLIFSPESNFYTQDRIDIVKVAQTLKENGLLNLFFKEPQELRLSFKTTGSPLFFVKIMGDTLRNIGYYRYVTVESNLDASAFTWTISLSSEHATDPLLLQKELQKSACGIIDIKRNSSNNWEYAIDSSNGQLNVVSLVDTQDIKLKRSLYAHWINVSKIQNLKISSSYRDSWYPKISYYNKQLNLLKVIEKDDKTKVINLQIPKCAKYIKISDIYTLKNVRDNLVLTPSGSR